MLHCREVPKRSNPMKSSQPPDHTFQGRVRPKDENTQMLGAVDLPHTRLAFIYKRLSTYEQVKKSIFSVAMQDGLKELAIEDGYPESLIVEEGRDLGLSGTLGSENRPGLAYLIELIEADRVESIYVVHISRLFRDQTLIDGLSFGELCKRHRVMLVMPNVRLNLADKMHMRIYRMELERAADELEVMKLRMGGARELKARQGFYVTGAIPVGYLVAKSSATERSGKFQVYEPHAAVIHRVVDAFVESGCSRVGAALALQDERVPFFPPDLEYMLKISAVSKMKHDDRGYLISKKFITRVCTNPAYISWWIWGGKVISTNNHPPILQEEQFWYVQDRLKEKRRGGRKVYLEPPLLYRLLYCTNHERATLIHHDLSANRYRCNGDQSLAGGEHYCFGCQLDVLDIPIGDFVTAQCAYPEFAEKIVQHLKQGYDEAKARAETHKRDLARLAGEIEQLKQNLAYTKTPEQVQLVLTLIDARIKEKEALSTVKAYPAGRVGAAIDIDKVKDFLVDIRDHWRRWPAAYRNEFLSLVLDRVLVTPVTSEAHTLRARIVWKSGFEQELLIFRPDHPGQPEHRWTKAEQTTLRQLFPRAPWGQILRKLPNHGYYSILDKAQRLKLKRLDKPYGRRDPFSEAEDAIALEVALGRLDLVDALDRVDRTPSAILKRLAQLGYPRSRFWKEKGAIRW
jgi:DNA invertase Pin-like site-specific DNA recombinase